MTNEKCMQNKRKKRKNCDDFLLRVYDQRLYALVIGAAAVVSVQHFAKSNINYKGVSFSIQYIFVYYVQYTAWECFVKLL